MRNSENTPSDKNIVPNARYIAIGINKKMAKEWRSSWPTKQTPLKTSPSTFPSARTEMVCTAGIAQAIK